MNIAKQIEEIIAQRQQQAKELEGVLKKWESLKQTLKKLENERLKHLTINSEGTSNIAVRLQTINFSKLIDEINEELIELKTLKKRLSSETLNIGVVGRMRQGKSTLLRSLTGLSDDEIPTSSGGVCTRGLSKIFHVTNPGEVRNEVEFHSWPSFKEIIDLYFDKLDLEGSKPNIQDDIELESPPRLSKDIAQNVNARFLYGRLRKEYYSKFKDYKSLLTGSSRVIPPEDIKKYTTLIEDNDDTANSEYLAVKELRIYCQFPHQDEVGKIGVIDLPGLGDNSISDVELLIKTLKQDIDFILFVRRPDLIGSDWEDSDRNMYQIASEALGDFPIKDCSFMVLNKIKEQEKASLEACERFRDSIESQEIKVSQSVIANCADHDEVKNTILIPVLSNLTQNIHAVYGKYLSYHNQRLERLRGEIGKKLELSRNLLEGYGEQEEQGFNAWFHKILWENLNSEIFRKLAELEEKQNQAESKFQAEVEKVVKSCREDNTILSLNYIKGLRAKQQNSWKISYYMCINEVKQKLTRDFESLATTLEESEKELQKSVVNILIKDGNLGNLTVEKEIEFFQEIEKQLPIVRNARKLTQAFQEIHNPTRTYKDTIIEWIQPHLDELNPDQHLDPISKNQLSPNNLDVTPEEVNELEKTVSNLTDEQVSQIETSISNPTTDLVSEISKLIGPMIGIYLPDVIIQKSSRLAVEQIFPFIHSLIRRQKNTQVNGNTNPEHSPNLYSAELLLKEIDSIRNDVVNKCENKLCSVLNFPNKMAHSKYDKFVTLAFNNEDAKIEWLDFYGKHQAKLYPGADLREENQKIEREWENLVNYANQANEDDGLLLYKR
jgi:hypothetical protein